MKTETDLTRLYQIFPFSNEKGGETNGINTYLLHQQTKQAPTLSPTKLIDIITQHHNFLNSGGAGGNWKVLLIRDFVTGIYEGVEGTDGIQACFERKHLGKKLDFINQLIPFANFCNVYAPAINCSNADLSYCLFSDSFLEQAVFTKTNLAYTDFSRANLKDVNFVSANLQGADFENCDLTNADFSGANLKGARFPGTKLNGVKY